MSQNGQMEVISGIINLDMHLCSWRMVCLIREKARMNKCAVYSLSVYVCVFKANIIFISGFFMSSRPNTRCLNLIAVVYLLSQLI